MLIALLMSTLVSRVCPRQYTSAGQNSYRLHTSPSRSKAASPLRRQAYMWLLRDQEVRHRWSWVWRLEERYIPRIRMQDRYSSKWSSHHEGLVIPTILQ